MSHVRKGGTDNSSLSQVVTEDGPNAGISRTLSSISLTESKNCQQFIINENFL